MDANKKNLIGKEMSVVNSQNPSLIGKKGIIVDETKNTLRIIHNKQKQSFCAALHEKRENKEYTLVKDQVTIEIRGTGTINGQDIVKQATDRIKVKK